MKVIVALLALAVIATALPAPRLVENEVFAAMEKNGGKADVIIQLRSHDWDMDHLDTMPRVERLWYVYKTLNAFADREQGPIRQYLSRSSFRFSHFWISNVIKVEDANVDLINAVASLFPNVVAVHLERFLSIPEPIDMEPAVNTTTVAEYGINLIKAPEAWALGYDGTGITVANVDTGVRYTHEALRPNYRGTKTGSNDYNWYDKTRNSTPNPSDGNGHGTHTMGTVAGTRSSGVGVAPGSVWIAGKGCGTAACSTADLLGSGQFLACPTKLDGSAPDCSKAPHVVNNSWGGGQGDTWYQDVIKAWLAGGIFPVFSAGNSGPNCGTANSPADNNNVISVAASDSRDVLASFSSRGPAVRGTGIGTQKPEISAPGVSVRSSWSTGDTAYNSISGTSMAGPHVAGVVALMKQARPNLTYNQIYNIITSTADTSSIGQPSGATTCGGVAWNTFPNYHYGYGRINALKCVQAALALQE